MKMEKGQKQPISFSKPNKYTVVPCWIQVLACGIVYKNIFSIDGISKWRCSQEVEELKLERVKILGKKMEIQSV